MQCLDNGAIEDLVQGRLPPSEEFDVLAHVSDCDRCSERTGAVLAGMGGVPPTSDVTTQDLSAAHVRAEASAFSPGAIVKERYRIIRRLGAGGAGEVYEVGHLHLPKRLALKVLHAGAPLTTAAMLRFRREARILADLKHPNIVEVFDFDFACGRPFFVMEYVEGRELSKLIEPGRGVPGRALPSIVGQLCGALKEMHARGIIHRDLKPQNILVTGRDDAQLVAKIVDFGLSRERDPSTVVTASQAVVGTPLYMSPEQAEGRNHDIDVHTDQFSLGAICYEMLTGRPAFKADSLAATIHKVISVDPPRMCDGDSALSVSPAVDAVIRRATSKKIAARYPSVDEFWRAFSASWPPEGSSNVTTVRDGATLPVMGPPLPREREAARGRRAAIAGAAVAFGTLALVAAVTLASRSPGPSAAAPVGPAPALAAPAVQVADVAARPASAPPVTAEAPPAAPSSLATRKAPSAKPHGPSKSAPVSVAARATGSLELLRRAEEALDDGRLEDARVLGLAAAEQQPAQPDTWELLGRCYMRLGRPKEARVFYARYLALAPNGSKAAYVRAIVARGGTAAE
jgi:serine/threonine-protein kinase